MVTFTRPVATAPDLYVGTSAGGGDGGWLGYVLPSAPASLTSLPLADAFGTYGGSLLFAPRPPTLSDAAATTLVTAVEQLIAGGPRQCLWLLQPDAVTQDTTLGFGFKATSGTSGSVAPGMDIEIGANLVLSVTNGSPIAVVGDALALSPGINNIAPVSWGGPAALAGGFVSAASIPCAGPQRGCVQFAQAIQRASLHDNLNWGFQTVIAGTSDGDRFGWYPLAEGGGVDRIPIGVSVDPADPFNAITTDRTAFAFTDASTTLISGYRTSSGWPVTLAPVVTPTGGAQPARLWLDPSPRDVTAKRDFVAGPVGDFVLGVQANNGATGPPALLCGLAGTETIAFAQGDTLRFSGAGSAFAAGFPYPDASPTLPPVDPTAPKLTDRYRTSWASLVTASGDGGHYSAQPKGASLYAKPTSGDAGVLVFTEPGLTLDKNAPVPLLPYGLVADGTGTEFSIDDFTEIETKVVAAQRRESIKPAPHPTRSLLADGTAPATTPTGLVVQVDQSTGAYAEVDLAQDVDRTPNVVMKLTKTTTLMQQALQTSQLFLVAANADALGTRVGWPVPDPAPKDPAFYNAMTIGDWALLADTGRPTSYGDYNNVLIIKGRRGKLADLVAQPDLWTEPKLAIPGGTGGDPSGLAALSKWLQAYIADAAAQSSDYFTAFNALVQDENWTGVLVLKADIAEVPSDLTGLLGGIDRSRFNAHHFGFTITKVDPASVTMSGNSATFGLIYYVDPAFDPDASPPKPVAPATSPWEFRVLTLKALFANASVQRFESYAQLTLQQLFGQAVDHMGAEGANPYDALIMTGSLHKQGGVTTYGLEAQGDATFFFDGGVFNKIEVLQAQFSTTGREPANGVTKVSARVDLYGFLDFKTLADGGASFDLFSFGSTDGQALQQGLSFSGLGITTSFEVPNDPTKAAFKSVYAFDASKMAFDATRSTPRTGSLFTSLALKVDSLVTGTTDSTPRDAGYLDVATPLRLPGVRGDWYGLRLQANFGTPGALAGKIGLTSYLLLTWSPPSAGAAARLGLGLRLPGAGQSSSLLSLQGVMKLAVGPIALTQVKSSGGGPAFMLVMSEIALQFLGILKLPPSGATAFYVFGDTTGNGGPLGWFALYKGPDPPTQAKLTTTGVT
jgi:hypothetical protein